MVAVRPTLSRWEETRGGSARRSRRAGDAFRRLARNKVTLAGSVVALLYVVVGLIGPVFAPHDYATQDLMATFRRPLSEGHLLGTDQLGRDVLSRLVVGIRISLLIGFGVTAISLLIGTLAGGLAGFYGGGSIR